MARKDRATGPNKRNEQRTQPAQMRRADRAQLAGFHLIIPLPLDVHLERELWCTLPLNYFTHYETIIHVIIVLRT